MPGKAESVALQPVADRRQARLGVGRVRGLGTAFHHRNDHIVARAEGEHVLDQVRVEKGHVAGYDEDPRVGGGGQTGVDAAQRALAGVAVFDDTSAAWDRKAVVDRRVGDHGDQLLAHTAQPGHHAAQQRLAVEGLQPLVPPQPLARAAGQDDSRHRLSVCHGPL